MASDKLGWVTPAGLAAAQRRGGTRGEAARRVSFADAPDGTPALQHAIRKEQEIWPFGYDTPTFFPKPGYCGAMLTYRMWQEKDRWQGQPGKFMALMGGRGMAGGSYTKSPSAQLGSEGWSHVSMHPESGGKNYIRGYVYSANRGSTFGKTYGNGGWTTLTGRWVTVSLVTLYNDPGQSNGIAQVYVDGQKKAQLNGIMWARNPTDAKGLWVRLRRMYGGNPDQLPPPMDLKEWFKDFEIHVSY